MLYKYSSFCLIFIYSIGLLCFIEVLLIFIFLRFHARKIFLVCIKYRNGASGRNFINSIDSVFFNFHQTTSCRHDKIFIKAIMSSFFENSFPYLRRLLHRLPASSGLSRRGRCIDHHDIPFGSPAPRIAHGRNRTRSRSPLK